jgi:predicted hydrocarbon binding protein
MMNRLLLEEMLEKMKKKLQTGENIGNLKIGALFALGSQLEAIFYFIGHELGSKIDPTPFSPSDLKKALIELAEKYHLGKISIMELDAAHVTFRLEHCLSCGEIERTDIKIEQGFCSFEAGLFAGFVEKLTNKHCFAQEINCRLQGHPECEYMIVIPEN